MDSNIENLVREFEQLKAMEKQAADLYQSILPSIKKSEDKKTLEEIIKDELRHENMVQGIIDIINS